MRLNLKIRNFWACLNFYSVLAPHPLFAVPAVWGVFSGQASAKEYSSCSSPDIHFTVTGAPTSRQEVLDALEMKIRYGSANDAANAFAQEKGYAYMRYYNVDNKIKYIRAACFWTGWTFCPIWRGFIRRTLKPCLDLDGFLTAMAAREGK